MTNFPEVLQLFTIDSAAMTVSPPDPSEHPIERETYGQCKRALQKAGGKWNKRDACFDFHVDPEPLVQSIIDGKAYDFAKDTNFFPTPDHVAARVVELAMLKRSFAERLVVLEPHLGAGSMIKAFHDNTAGIESVVAYCELNEALRKIGEQHLGENPVFIAPDYLSEEARRPGAFHYIFANPPFRRGEYFDHLSAMIIDLAPGGVAAVILPTNWLTAERGKPQAARELLGLPISDGKNLHRTFREYEEIGYSWTSTGEEQPPYLEVDFYALPSNSFDGTAIDTCVIILHKVDPISKRNQLFEETTTVQPVADHKGEKLPSPRAVDFDLSTPVEPSPWQPRKSFDLASLESLGSNILRYGLLQPISLLEKDGSFTLIAGERRLRAAKHIGLESIPANIYRGLTPTQHAALTLAENSNREAVDPIDEALHICKMSEAGTSTEEISSMLGIGRTTVRRRLALSSATATAVAAYRDKRLTLAHLEYLAAQPANLQSLVMTKVIDKLPAGGPHTSTASIKSAIESATENLENAPWDLTSPLYDRPACNMCPKNTSRANTLFAIDDSAKCTDVGCFQHKASSHHDHLKTMMAKASNVEPEKVDKVLIDHFGEHPYITGGINISAETFAQYRIAPSQVECCTNPRHAYIAHVASSFYEDLEDHQQKLKQTPIGDLIPYCKQAQMGKPCTCSVAHNPPSKEEAVFVNPPSADLKRLKTLASRAQHRKSNAMTDAQKELGRFISENDQPLNNEVVECMIASMILYHVTPIALPRDYPQFQDLKELAESRHRAGSVEMAINWVKQNPRRANNLVRLILFEQIRFDDPLNQYTDQLIGNQTAQQAIEQHLQEANEEPLLTPEEAEAMQQEIIQAAGLYFTWAQISPENSEEDFLTSLQLIDRKRHYLNAFGDPSLLYFLRMLLHSGTLSEVDRLRLESDIDQVPTEPQDQEDAAEITEKLIIKYRPQLHQLHQAAKS